MKCKLLNMVCNIGLSPYALCAVAENLVCIFCIYVIGNGCHSFHLPQQPGKLCPMGQALSVDNHADHDFSRGKSVANQHMTEQSLPCSLIIWCNPLLFHPFLNDTKDFFVLLHSEIAILHRNDIVTSACIKSEYNIPVLVIANRKLSLVALPERLVHSDNRPHSFFYFSFIKVS